MTRLSAAYVGQLAPALDRHIAVSFIESAMTPPRKKDAAAIAVPMMARITAYSAADAPLLARSSLTIVFISYSLRAGKCPVFGVNVNLTEA